MKLKPILWETPDKYQHSWRVSYGEFFACAYHDGRWFVMHNRSYTADAEGQEATAEAAQRAAEAAILSLVTKLLAKYIEVPNE